MSPPIFCVVSGPVLQLRASDSLTVYPIMADPPVSAGGLHDAEPSTPDGVICNPDTDRPVGAPGAVTGVTTFNATDASEEPATLVAVTVNEYAVPLVRPVTAQEVDELTSHVNPPGAEVTT